MRLQSELMRQSYGTFDTPDTNSNPSHSQRSQKSQSDFNADDAVETRLRSPDQKFDNRLYIGTNPTLPAYVLEICDKKTGKIAERARRNDIVAARNKHGVSACAMRFSTLRFVSADAMSVRNAIYDDA